MAIILDRVTTTFYFIYKNKAFKIVIPVRFVTLQNSSDYK